MTLCKNCQQEIPQDQLDNHRRGCSQDKCTALLIDVTVRPDPGKYQRVIFRQPDGRFYCPTFLCAYGKSKADTFLSHVRKCDVKVNAHSIHPLLLFSFFLQAAADRANSVGHSTAPEHDTQTPGPDVRTSSHAICVNAES